MDLAFKNSDGKRDPILTLAIISVIVVLLKVLGSGVTFNFGGAPVSFGTIDGGLVGAILTPTLGAAVAHRYTDKHFEDKNNNGIDDKLEGDVK